MNIFAAPGARAVSSRVPLGYHLISNPSASLSGFYVDFLPNFGSGITVRPSRGTVRQAVRLAREGKLCIKGETDVGAAGFALLAWEDPNGADGALSPICA